jgi:hypothetical protein
MKSTYTVVVGNIGVIHRGTRKSDALLIARIYEARSKSGHGRCAGRSVVVFRDKEMIASYAGTEVDIATSSSIDDV